MKILYKPEGLLSDTRYYLVKWRGKNVIQDSKTTNIYFFNKARWDEKTQRFIVPYVFMDNKLRQDVSYWDKEKYENVALIFHS